MIVKRSNIPHPHQNTPTPHHRSPQPPNTTHLFLENKHSQHGRDEEIGGRVGDGDFGGGGGGCQGAGEESPHYYVTEGVEGEAGLFFISLFLICIYGCYVMVG